MTDLSPAVRDRNRDPEGHFAPEHGAHSEDRIRPAARAQKRRWLRQMGLRAGDLEGIALALLDSWARAQAKVVLLDRWFDEHGFLDADGKPQPATAVYFTALNSARLAAVRLAEHLKAKPPGGDELHRVIEQIKREEGERDADG